MNNQNAFKAELEKHGFTLEQFNEAWEAVKALIRRIVKAVAKIARRVLDAVYFVTARHPKHYYLYKHAKKWRTRKKYRNLLRREAIAYMRGVSP